MNVLNNIFKVLVLLVFITSCNTEYDFSYNKVTETSGATSWIFEGNYKPPLHLSDDAAFVHSINLVLDTLQLPLVEKAVLEKEKITGFRTDRRIFEWDVYPLGILRVTRSSAKDAKYNDYDCIWKVTLTEKNKSTD